MPESGSTPSTGAASGGTNKVAIGVGIGLGIPLALALVAIGIFVALRRRPRSRSGSIAQQDFPPAKTESPPFEMQHNNTLPPKSVMIQRKEVGVQSQSPLPANSMVVGHGVQHELDGPGVGPYGSPAPLVPGQSAGVDNVHEVSGERRPGELMASPPPTYTTPAGSQDGSPYNPRDFNHQQGQYFPQVGFGQRHDALPELPESN